MSENTLLTSHNLLYMPELKEESDREQKFIASNFCGIVVDSFEKLRSALETLPSAGRKRIVYVTGNVLDVISLLKKYNVCIFIVQEYSRNAYAVAERLIGKGQVPINVHNAGVLFRRFFGPRDDYFSRIQAEHEFQTLTQSNTPGTAFRKGIYLTDVVRQDENTVAFHLLRCSSNLGGPTDNFSATDRDIVRDANEIAQYFFAQPVDMNHVLAQIYFNSRDADTSKETKAKISRHSDKTKDMPANALIGFASFYDFSQCDRNGAGDRSKEDEFDVCYRQSSILTQLEFVLKDSIKCPTLKKSFRVTLYPNSLFLISLETNRLYTHKIKPSTLPVSRIPTRLGYVIRCSKTKAIHRGGRTYILSNDTKDEQPLEEINGDAMREIKDLYFQENVSDAQIKYPAIYTSLNNGDYKMPLNARTTEATNHSD